MILATKRCNCCGFIKPLNDFSKASSCVDGHRNYCKACHKIRKDQWRAKNSAHHNAKSKQWVVKNKEARAAVSKRYNSKPEVKARGPEYKRKYRARNHIKCKAQVSARRDKVKVATPKWVDMGAIEEIYRQAIYTGMTVDHIVPIKHPDVCGLHVPWNLQLLSAAENYSKSNLFNGARTRERSQNASKKR